MNRKALFMALRFAFLPTAVVILLMMFGLFSITKVFEFISSSHGGAIAIRIALFILEVGLIVFMYEYYKKKLIFEGTIKEPLSNKNNGKSISYSEYARDLFRSGNSSDGYTKYTTEDPNLVIIERKPKIS